VIRITSPRREIRPLPAVWTPPVLTADRVAKAVLEVAGDRIARITAFNNPGLVPAFAP
jgi:hypothetical protein